MGYKLKTPPIRLTLSIDEFNLLIGILKFNEVSEMEDSPNKVSVLKDKLLKYSVPRTNANGEYVVDIRYFTNEASFVIQELLKYNKGDAINVNYFENLVENRKKFLEKSRNESN